MGAYFGFYSDPLLPCFLDTVRLIDARQSLLFGAYLLKTGSHILPLGNDEPTLDLIHEQIKDDPGDREYRWDRTNYGRWRLYSCENPEAQPAT